MITSIRSVMKKLIIIIFPVIFSFIPRIIFAQSTLPVKEETIYPEAAGYGLLLLIFIIFWGLIKYGNNVDEERSDVVSGLKSIIEPYTPISKDNIQFASAAAVLNIAYYMLFGVLLLNIILIILLI